jgi:hypothetical protein
MKAFTIIMKILAAAAAVVGAVYVAATYGDKIVAWAKKMLPCCPACEETEEAPAVEEEAVEEAPVVEEETVEEVVEEEVAPVVEEEAPVADEADFEG